MFSLRHSSVVQGRLLGSSLKPRCAKKHAQLLMAPLHSRVSKLLAKKAAADAFDASKKAAAEAFESQKRAATEAFESRKQAAAETFESKDESFKTKGFGIRGAFYLRKRPLEPVASLADFKATSLNFLPVIQAFTKQLIKSFPRDAVEFQRAMTDTAFTVQEMIARGIHAMPDLNEIKSTPMPAFTIGCAGLVPLVLPPLRFMAAGQILPGWEFFQLAYGACVLSFVGGGRWGIIVKDDNKQLRPDWPDLGLGVIPPLCAFSGLLFPPFVGNLLMVTGFALAAYVDLLTPGIPNWYKVLRIFLTGGAIFCLVLTLLLKLILPRKPCNQ